MKAARDILRQKFELKLSNRSIARSVDVSPSTVSECLGRAASAKMCTWPLPAELDSEDTLEKRLCPKRPQTVVRAEPNFQLFHFHRILSFQS